MPDATHVLIVLAPYLLLPLAGWLGGRGARYARWLALVPAALTGYYAWAFAQVASTGPFTATLPWASSLGLSLSFHYDGLGLLFATLVTGIGALIVLYAVGYLGDDPRAGRFQLTLFAFMGSMLGVVLSDNVILLFVFWELTGFTSYFLIAFDHERREARRAALQALLVTGAGGLALLAAEWRWRRRGARPASRRCARAGARWWATRPMARWPCWCSWPPSPSPPSSPSTSGCRTRWRRRRR
jgi:multicomponent Na+:H+ antiporter subunit A